MEESRTRDWRYTYDVTVSEMCCGNVTTGCINALEAMALTEKQQQKVKVLEKQPG